MRIEPLDPQQATGDQVKALAAGVGKLNLFRVLSHGENIVLPVMRLGGAILGKTRLDGRTRELAVLVALQLKGGRYEWPQHVDIGLDAGITAEEIAAIERMDLETHFSPRDRALLAFTREAVENVRVAQPLYDAVRQYLDEQEMVELLLSIGFYSMLAHFTEALDMEPDPVAGRGIIRALGR